MMVTRNGQFGTRTVDSIRMFIKSQAAKAILIIFLVLLAAYSVPLLLGRSQNPLLQRSGLAGMEAPGIVSGQNTIDPNDGFTSQALGRRAAVSLSKGDMPYWNHYEGLGMPLAAGMQSAALFPLTVLLRLHNGFIYIHFILQLIAGVATYLFLRKLKVRYSLAIVGGILFSLNGAFAWLTNAPFNPIAFLPVLLLGFEYAVEKTEKKAKGGWILIALALSLSLFAGFPESAFINAIFAFGWGAVRLFQLDKRLRVAYVRKIIAASVTGLLLAAPILVPFLSYLSQATTGGHEGGGFAYYGLSFTTLPSMFMPYIFGPIFAFTNLDKTGTLNLYWSNVGGYLTAMLLLLAIFGMFAKRVSGIKWYLFAFSVVIILKIYGFKPVAFVLNLIPGMSQVAFYRYSIPVLCFALVVLAVFGADAFIRSEIPRKKAIALTLAVAGGIALLSFQAYAFAKNLAAYPSHRYWAVMSVCWALAVLAVIGLCFVKEKLRFAGIVTLLVLDTFVMFIVPYFSLPKTSSVDYGPVSFLQQNLGLSRFYTLGPIAPNYGSYYGIASININDLPVPKKWVDYIPEKLDKNALPIIFTGYTRVDPNGPTSLDEFSRNESEYEEIGVKYLVTSRNQIGEEFARQHGLTKVFAQTNYEIYQLPITKPFYESVATCTIGTMELQRFTSDCVKDTTIIRRELSLPGWSAVVNGHRQAVGSYGKLYQSVSVPAGKSDVRFTYSPPHIEIGYMLFGLGLAAIAWQVIPSKFYSRKQR